MMLLMDANDQRAHDHLAAIMRSARINAGMTQRDVAVALGKPQSFVSKYESAERHLDIVTLSRICRVVGTSLQRVAQMLEEGVP